MYMNFEIIIYTVLCTSQLLRLLSDVPSYLKDITKNHETRGLLLKYLD